MTSLSPLILFFLKTCKNSEIVLYLPGNNSFRAKQFEFVWQLMHVIVNHQTTIPPKQKSVK